MKKTTQRETSDPSMVIPLHWNEAKLAYTARNNCGISSCICLLQSQLIVHNLVADMERDTQWRSLSEAEKYRRARSLFFQEVAQAWGVPCDPNVIDAWPSPVDTRVLSTRDDAV